MANKFVPFSAFLRLTWTLADAYPAYNVFGVHNPNNTAINQALANTLDTAIKAGFASSALNGQLAASVHLDRVGIRDWNTPNQAEYEGTGARVSGTAVGDMLPGGVAYCVTLRTALAGARYRGRCYIPGIAEAGNDVGGVATAAVQTACVNFVASIRTTLSSNGLALGVLSRPSDKKVIQTTKTLPDGTTEIEQEVQEARPGAITPVTAVVGRNLIWDSQRRRNGAGSTSTVMLHRYLVDDTTPPEAVRTTRR